MKKIIQVYIESGPQDLLNQLQATFKEHAILKRVEVTFHQYIDNYLEQKTQNCLQVLLLSSEKALDKFHLNTRQNREFFAMCEINSHIRPAIHLLREKEWDEHILDFAMIGGQRQFFNTEEYDYLDKKYYNFLHLGDVKREISEIEPYLRDAHVMRMSFNALRAADFPSKQNFNPSGFFAEDFIAISRYIGLSPNLEHLVFHDIDIDKLKASYSCQELVSQMLWYMGEGYGFRQKEKPDSDMHEHFLFNLEEPEIEVEFIRSKESGRWWFQFTDRQGIAHTFSCNYTDFEGMENRIVSPRIKSAILRYL